MKRLFFSRPSRVLIVLVVCCLLTGRGNTQNTPAAPVAKIDQPMRDFTFRNLASRNGSRVRLSSFRGRKPIILVFMANRCGLTWTYAKQVAALTTEYAGRAQVLVVHSNYEESDGELLGHLETSRIIAPVLDDKPTQSLARYLSAVCTPTFAIVDERGILRYKGGYEENNNPAKPFLLPALNAVLAHQPVRKKSTRAIGCEIEPIPTRRSGKTH